MVIAARSAGVKHVIVPQDNLREASLVTGIQVYGFAALKDVVDFLEDKKATSRLKIITAPKLGRPPQGLIFAMSRGRMA